MMELISVKVGLDWCCGGIDISHRITRSDKMLKLLLLAALASVTWGRNYPPYKIKDDDYGLVDDETPNRHKAPLLQAHITYDEDDEQDLVAEAYPDENDDYGFKPVIYEGKSDSSGRKRTDGKQGLYKGSDISEEIRLSRKNQNEEDIQVKKQQSLYGKRLPVPQPQGTYKGSDEVPKALPAYGTRNAKDYNVGVDDSNLGGYGHHGPAAPIYQQGVNVDIENHKPCAQSKSNILQGVKGGRSSYDPVETGLKEGAYGIEGGYMGYGKYKSIMLGGVDYAGVTYAGPSPQVYHGVKGGSGSHLQDSRYGGIKGGSGAQTHESGYGGIKGGSGYQSHGSEYGGVKESGYGGIKEGSGSQSHGADYGGVKGGNGYQSHGSEYGGVKESGYGGIKGGSGSQSNDAGYGRVKGGRGYQSHGSEYGGVKESGYGGIKGGSGFQSHDAGYGGIKGRSGYQSHGSEYAGVKESDYGGIKGGSGSQLHDAGYGGIKEGSGYQSHESGYGGVKGSSYDGIKGGIGSQLHGPSYGAPKGGSGYQSHESGYGGVKGGSGSQSQGASYGGVKGGSGAQSHESGYGGIKGGSASKSLESGYGGIKGGSGVQSHGSGYGGVKGGIGSQSHASGYGGIKGGTESHKYGSEDNSEYGAGNVKVNSGSHKLGSDAFSGSGYHSSSGSPTYGSGLSSTSGYGSGVHDYHGVKGGANTGSYGKPGHYDDLKTGYGQGEKNGAENYGYNKGIESSTSHSSLYSGGQIRPNVPTGNYGSYDKQRSYGAPEKIESSYYDSSKNLRGGNEESHYKIGNSGYTDRPLFGSVYRGSDRVSMPGGPRYHQNEAGSRYNAPSGTQLGYDVSRGSGYSPVTDYSRAGGSTYQQGAAGPSVLHDTALRRPSYSPQLSSVGPQFDYSVPTGHSGAPQASGVSSYGQNTGGYQTGSPNGVTSSYGPSGAPAASRYSPGSSPSPVHGSPSYGNNGGLSSPGPSYPNHARPYSPSNSGSHTGGAGLVPHSTGISNLPSSTYQGPGASSINSGPGTYGSYGSGPSAAIVGPAYGQGITPYRSVESGGHDSYAPARPSSVPTSSNQQVGGDNGRILHLPSYQDVGAVSHNNLPPYSGNRAVGQSAPSIQSQPGYGSRLGGSSLPAAGSSDRAYGPDNSGSQGYPSGRPSPGGYDGRQGSAGGSPDSSRGGSKDGEENENSEPKPYHFEFVAPDTHPESTHFRKESGDGLGNVSGSYGYKDETGLYRHVDYEANKDGFKANVKTNEPGTENQNPADVLFEVEKTVDPRY